MQKNETLPLATAQGIDTIITNGARPEALCDIVAGKAAETLFAGRKRIPDLDTGNGDVPKSWAVRLRLSCRREKDVV